MFVVGSQQFRTPCQTQAWEQPCQCNPCLLTSQEAMCCGLLVICFFTWRVSCTLLVSSFCSSSLGAGADLL